MTVLNLADAIRLGTQTVDRVFAGGEVVLSKQVYPLDLVEGGPPLAAYATVKLIEAYAGPAVRVVRPSDGATLDVGFVRDGLDV